LDTRSAQERRKQEVERGRLVAARAQRASDLDRYVAGKKVKIMVALPGHPYYVAFAPARVNIFYVDGIDIGHENVAADNYPSEALMAKIALAVGATVGMDGIPSAQTIDPEVRRRRDEYRNRMGAQVQK
jgi:hypothetical protein